MSEAFTCITELSIGIIHDGLLHKKIYLYLLDTVSDVEGMATRRGGGDGKVEETATATTTQRGRR